ncbi:hypothetical protein V6N13_013946 [Hibiscus sabdariffa]
MVTLNRLASLESSVQSTTGHGWDTQTNWPPIGLIRTGTLNKEILFLCHYCLLLWSHQCHLQSSNATNQQRDDPKLEAGEEIPPQLFRAIQQIQQSWCSIIVLSRTYALSSWCLEELAEIVKQKNEKGHKVFPIFYDVDPSDVRKQKEKVEEAFAKHQERYKEDKEKILRWRNSLTQVANIKGWHLNNSSHLEELYSKIEIGEDDIRIIGICGMGGIGSRIFVTARDEHLLQSYRVDDVYKLSTLNDDDALQLFNLKAFDSETVPKDAFIKLSEHVVKYASGLPLAF